jgi:hypothetical protein
MMIIRRLQICLLYISDMTYGTNALAKHTSLLGENVLCYGLNKNKKSEGTDIEIKKIGPME